MKAWLFKGNQNSYVKLSGNVLDLGSQDFTMAAFFYQDVLLDGTLMEYRGKTHGTHIGIYEKVFYINLEAASRNVVGKFGTLVAKKWHFVGISLNTKRGILLTWIDEKVGMMGVGPVGKREMSGDLYIGVRLGDNRAFRGRIAGATLMNCAVGLGQDEVSALRTDIIKRAGEYIIIWFRFP